MFKNPGTGYNFADIEKSAVGQPTYFNKNMLLQTLLFFSLLILHVVSTKIVSKSACEISSYYSALSSNYTDLSFGELSTKLHSLVNNHVILPYTSSEKNVIDVWAALMQLDGVSNNSVRLIYSNRNISNVYRGETVGWNREHLWPKSYGVGASGADTTDLMHIRPADWNVNSARSNLFFDDCLTSSCVSPAHIEAAPDSAKNSEQFMPPASVRGDIARSMFYMALRYNGKDDNTVDLKLCDTPQAGFSHMGVLSTLLEWHRADPVDDGEIGRNSLICSNFQGNRNVFIDFPDTAELLFESQQMGRGNNLICDCDVIGYDCNQEAHVTQINPGELLMVCVNSFNPDSFSVLTLIDLLPGTSFTVTDGGCSSISNDPRVNQDFISTEGSLTYTVDGDGLTAGRVIHWDSSNVTKHWTQDSKFKLSMSSDQLFIFSGSVIESKSLVFGMSLYSDWLPRENPPKEGVTATSSFFPSTLEAHKTISSIVLEDYNNAILVNSYKLDYEWRPSKIQSYATNVNHWKGSSNSSRYECRSLFDLNMVEPDIKLDDNGEDGDYANATSDIRYSGITIVLHFVVFIPLITFIFFEVLENNMISS